MNSQEPKNWQQKLQDLEEQINQQMSTNSASRADSQDPLPNANIKWDNLNQKLEKAKTWFGNLNSPAKAVVAIASIVVGFAVLGTVLKVISSLVSIAILGVLLYLLYKFFFAPQTPK